VNEGDSSVDANAQAQPTFGKTEKPDLVVCIAPGNNITTPCVACDSNPPIAAVKLRCGHFLCAYHLAFFTDGLRTWQTQQAQHQPLEVAAEVQSAIASCPQTPAGGKVLELTTCALGNGLASVGNAYTSTRHISKPYTQSRGLTPTSLSPLPPAPALPLDLDIYPSPTIVAVDASFSPHQPDHLTTTDPMPGTLALGLTLALAAMTTTLPFEDSEGGNTAIEKGSPTAVDEGDLKAVPAPTPLLLSF
ncbi:hypothetical protein FRB90_008047, partial [Tulasnella sp. 427]